ncbi:5-amino-6-(5-phosphoribosylamino)uracil reductase [Candidatus Riesia sp. GBBU]|nr:5-amino-6-(5-phosphoribosylamino)uracil reductase [Candidatus Riesia sp. GBBU]
MKDYDKKFMRRALYLAKLGRFTTTPNPSVGCVIVKNGIIISESYHRKAGEDHAEVIALKKANKEAKGSTVYVTLEPCNFYGNTPPCVDALINAKVHCVVIATIDPNPKVSGKGIKKLDKFGIKVIYGILKKEAEEINLGFSKRMRTGLPYIQLKLASSIDGRTALSSGESKWITSYRARQDVQFFRAQASAILTTGSTVFFDDPNLNVRWKDFPEKMKLYYRKEDIRQPIRIVIDKKNQVTDKHLVTRNIGECWLIRSSEIIKNWKGKVSQIIFRDGKINLLNLMKFFGRKKINIIFIECGPNFAASLIKEKLIDELIVYISPRILGSDAKCLINVTDIKSLQESYMFKFFNIKSFHDTLRLSLKPVLRRNFSSNIYYQNKF